MEPVLEVQEICKSYEKKTALDGVSFSLPPGKILGLLGPNGAGKTTLLRIIMGILLPDSGEIRFAGNALRLQDKESMGYLPEERGLYLKQSVRDVLYYLGSLKGLNSQQLDEEIPHYLKTMNLSDQGPNKVESLSKGMQQKVQIIAALLADPQLLIFDEPFTGLDPVNLRLVKDLILDMKHRGKAAILATHQMSLAQELCDHILFLNRGQMILCDSLPNVQQQYSQNAVLLHTEVELDQFAEVESIEREGDAQKVVLSESTDHQHFIRQVMEKGSVESFSRHHPPLEEIFIQLVQD